MIESPQSEKVDRLAVFFRAFDVSVLEDAAAPDTAWLAIETDPDGPRRIALYPHGVARERSPEAVGVGICFGGMDNPLMAALPGEIAADLGDEPALAGVAGALVEEMRQRRCGRQVGIDRLSQVAVLMLLRRAVDRGASTPGLLAGLSHPALRRALAAMHDEPGRAWRVEDLALLAGQSRSQFMKAFPRAVGVTPAAYLAQWRLTLARRELVRGDAIKAVARKAGFGSAEAFSRAFARRFGRPPSQAKPPEADRQTGVAGV